MSVVSAVELARTVEEELGGTQRAIRRFACVLSDDTLVGNPPTETEISTACVPGGYGSAHPTLSAYGLRKITINERFGDSPYHVEVIAEYTVVDAEELLVPWSRASVWTFEGAPSQIAALSYYDGDTLRPLVNSANDYLQGLVTDESMITATVKTNYQEFPSSQVQAANSVNSDGFLGAAAYAWKMTAANVAKATEVIGVTTYTYWAAEWKLTYRQTGWVLKIPDVGWNFLVGGEKRRCMVFDFQNSEWVASPTPMPLSSGQQIPNDTNSATRPDILDRRVNPARVFTNFFGSAP